MRRYDGRKSNMTVTVFVAIGMCLWIYGCSDDNKPALEGRYVGNQTCTSCSPTETLPFELNIQSVTGSSVHGLIVTPISHTGSTRLVATLDGNLNANVIIAKVTYLFTFPHYPQGYSWDYVITINSPVAVGSYHADNSYAPANEYQEGQITATRSDVSH